MDGQISRLYLMFILLSSIGLKNHVTLLPSIISTAGRDGWISVLLSVAVHTIWLFFIYRLIVKLNGLSLNEWLKEKAGKAVSLIISMSACVVLLSLSTVTILELGQWTTISYLPATPELLIVIIFALLCLGASLTSLQTIAILNGILLPVIILLGFFVMTGNIPNKDFSLLLPVLEEGFPRVFQGMVYSSAGLGEMVIVLFIQHRIKNRITYWQLLLFTGFLAILTLGPLTGGIMEFGTDETARLRFPAYEQWTLVALGQFVENVDFLSIFQWLSGSFLRISFLMYLITQMIPVKNRKLKTFIMCLLYTVMIFLTQLPESDMTYMAFVHNLYLPGTLIYFAGLTLLLTVVSFLPAKNKGGAVHETA